MPDDRKPDAVLVPPSRLDDPIAKLVLYEELCKTLGGKIWFGLDAHTGSKFGRIDPNQSRLHPLGHPLAKSDRYEWHIADRDKEGNWTALMLATGGPEEDSEVLLGFLQPDPYDEVLEVQARVKAVLEGRKDIARAQFEKRQGELAEEGRRRAEDDAAWRDSGLSREEWDAGSLDRAYAAGLSHSRLTASDRGVGDAE